MSASIYGDKLIVPNDQMLTSDLAAAKVYFDRICQFIDKEYGHLSLDWKYYSKKSGWILKLLNRKRNVLFVVPLKGSFRVAFTFGDKATQVILDADFSETLKKSLTDARRYAEGRTIQINVDHQIDCELITQLIQVKLNS